ncbi:Hpt domain-containing protein [Alteromonas sediminis]|uniref:Hpt domain-containing protein n=1 Tax=Alteromonas sediminis TaxID=2259342 RepID=A0A3N5YEU7_9ALTE|nr:Hpt domain-containing protein [Alteromonas sediminis]RPJ68395.1 Hpt domain-containing protein [Alteromonas sediminis]
MLIDYEFGLSQLSGNQALLITLYTRLHDEYKEADQQLSTLQAEGKLDEAKTLIHTLKGVAGNLGCQRLHQISREYDEEIKNGSVSANTQAAFTDALGQTIDLLARVIASGQVPPPEQSSSEGEAGQKLPLSDNLKKLVSALNNNEFVAPDHLSACMAELDLDEPQKEALAQAINTLDYHRALAILVN